MCSRSRWLNGTQSFITPPKTTQAHCEDLDGCEGGSGLITKDSRKGEKTKSSRAEVEFLDNFDDSAFEIKPVHCVCVILEGERGRDLFVIC